MTRFLLIRHGHFEGADDPFQDLAPTTSLDDLGREQMKLLANRLKSYQIKRIVTSELVRAKESGQIIADTLNLPTESTSILNEISSHFIKGLNLAALERSDEIFTPLVGTIEKAGRSAIQFLKDLSYEHQDEEEVAVVCHSKIIRAIVGQSLKADTLAAMRTLVDPSSLSIIDHQGADTFRLVRLNDISHLTDK